MRQIGRCSDHLAEDYQTDRSARSNRDSEELGPAWSSILELSAPVATSSVSPTLMLALQRFAGNQATVRFAQRMLQSPTAHELHCKSIVQRNGDGLRYRGKEKTKTTVAFTVGSRPAFFASSPATHAVYRMDGVVYGLAGDFGGVSIGIDRGGSNYTWAGPEVTISVPEAANFHLIAQNIASHMKYNLLTRNCFSPVAGALNDLVLAYEPPEKEEGENRPVTPRQTYDDLCAMQENLAEQNFGMGQQAVPMDTKKNQ